LPVVISRNPKSCNRKPDVVAVSVQLPGWIQNPDRISDPPAEKTHGETGNILM